MLTLQQKRQRRTVRQLARISHKKLYDISLYFINRGFYITSVLDEISVDVTGGQMVGQLGDPCCIRLVCDVPQLGRVEGSISISRKKDRDISCNSYATFNSPKQQFFAKTAMDACTSANLTYALFRPGEISVI